MKPRFISQASLRDTRTLCTGKGRHQKTNCSWGPGADSGSQCQFDPSQTTKTTLFLPAVFSPHPWLSGLLLTGQDTVYALHRKDEPVPNLRSAVNHQALLLPKARKHLIVCFQLCQRKGPCPVLILFGSQK